MEIRQWSNVICVNRGDKWAEVLQRYSVSPAIAKEALVELGVTDDQKFAVGVPEKCYA